MPGRASPSSQTRFAGCEGPLVELALEGVVDHRVAVDDLAGVGVDEDHVAHVALVRHLDGVGQDVGSGDASDGPFPVDVQLRGGCLDARQVSRRVGRARRVLAHGGHGAVGGLSGGQPGGHPALEIRGDETVDRGELTGLVDLRVELAAEDGDALVGLGELDRPSVGGRAHVRLGELVGLRAEHAGVLVEVGISLGARVLRGARRGARHQVFLRPQERDLTGGRVAAGDHLPLGLITDLRDE